MVIDAPDTWEWAQEHEIDGVVYRHGDPKHGLNTCKKWVDETYKSSINGHTHSHAQVRYFASGNGLLIGADFGCLIDVTQYAFAYTKGHRPPTLGCGIVKEGLSAYFIPMHCENGRWIKRIV